MKYFRFTSLLTLLASSALTIVHGIPGHPTSTTPAVNSKQQPEYQDAAVAPPHCFPAINFTMPTSVPTSLDNWWCPYETEYAFVGFSYEITACQSLSQLKAEFSDIRHKFGGRYIRLYGFCDTPGYYNDVVEAAWESGLGVFALIWFGFDGGTEYIGRRDALFSILHSNPKAKFVTRVLQFGSEPLFDWALSPSKLVSEVQAAKKNLSNLGIPVTVSDMAYSFNSLHANDGGPKVLASLDMIAAHILPFFSTKASIANESWPLVTSDLNYFVNNGNERKIWFTENGWPSVTSSGVQPNSPSAVANVQNEYDYYALLDKHCPDLKAIAGGGVGWFAHIYSDNQEPGYGIYKTNGKMKFSFAPRTSC